MIFNTYEWKGYKPDILMKGLEKLKEYFEYYKEREAYIQKYYYTENIDGYWISFPIIKEGHRVYFCPVLITPWSKKCIRN